jgi:hypothetical protein
MSTKKGKQDMNFDFDDVTGGKTTEKKKLPESADKEYMLTIPTERGFVSRAITECTEEEFLKWVLTVYPLADIPTEYEKGSFESSSKRIRALKQIEKLSTRQFFNSGKRDEKLVH